ncbi:MAG: hypothetical protein OQK13_03350, partial [Gammaproteobacteria bacterium]|nr:hypothetical protein [Gammaproteobacteria bacterium]
MLNALRRLILHLLLAVIVMTAFTSLMLRLLTPLLGEYRTDIEQWASQLIQQPISIESIDARMVGFSPQLKLTGVELLDLNRQFPIARFRGLSINFGLLSSLMSGNVTLDHIELHGLDISLVRDVNGKVSVSGLGGIQNGQQNDSDVKRGGSGFGAWLLQQGKVSLYKSHIRWLDMHQQQNFDFADVSVVLRNSGDEHNFYSVLELPDELGGELEVALNLKGNVFDNQSWGGDLYLRAEALNSQTILENRTGEQWNLQQGIIDGEFWGEIVAGHVAQIQGHLQAKGIKLKYNDRVMPLTQFDTQALLKQGESGWRLQLSRLTFGGSLRGKMPHYLQFQERDNGWHINIDRLNM